MQRVPENVRFCRGILTVGIRMATAGPFHVATRVCTYWRIAMIFLISRGMPLACVFLELYVQNGSAGLLIGAPRPSVGEVGVPLLRSVCKHHSEPPPCDWGKGMGLVVRLGASVRLVSM